MSKTIQFTDTSTNANTYFWDFGDGNTSTERNPIHTYQDDGEYVVTHTVTNDFGEASIQQTVSLGDTQVDEDTQIDDTEPNPINPPFGYNPSQGEFLAGTISPQGQWIWDGQVWNLNIGVDGQEPIEETIYEEPSYQVTLNESSRGVLDLINVNINSSEPYTEGTEVEFVVFFVRGYNHSVFVVELEPFITTPGNLNIELIEDNSYTGDDGTLYRDARYRFIMPSRDVSITTTAFLPEAGNDELGTEFGGDLNNPEGSGDDDLFAYNLTLNEESEGNLDLINFNVVSSEPYIEGNEIELVISFVTGYDHSPSDVRLRPFITTPENLEIQLIDDNSYTFSGGQEGREARYRFTMPGQDVSITATAFVGLE